MKDDEILTFRITTRDDDSDYGCYLFYFAFFFYLFIYLFVFNNKRIGKLCNKESTQNNYINN